MKILIDVTPAKWGKASPAQSKEATTREQHHQAMAWAKRLKRVFIMPQGTLS